MAGRRIDTIIVATLPPDVSAAAAARRLLRRHANGELGKNIGLQYEDAPFDLDQVPAIVDLPWKSDALATCATLSLRPGSIAAARRACATASRDLAVLAAAIHEVVHGAADGDGDVAELATFLDDDTSLLDPLEGDTETRQLAQVFTAVVRTLRRAERTERGLIVVHREQLPEDERGRPEDELPDA